MEEKVRVIIVGDGEDRGKLVSMALLSGLQKYLFFEGKQYGTDLIKAYKSAHCFILPSVFEGQPLTILEASAAKLPIICTDVGENKAMFKEGFAGWIVEPRSSAELAEAMLAAMNAKDLKRKGNQNYKHVQDYTWKKMAEKTEEVYNRVRANY